MLIAHSADEIGKRKKNAARVTCRRCSLRKTDFVAGNRVPEIIRK